MRASMGRAVSIVAPCLRRKLYDAAASGKQGIYFLYDNLWGEGLHYLEIISDLLPPGDNGVQDVILEDDGTFWFKKDVDV
jgi:hypothetical protein